MVYWVVSDGNVLTFDGFIEAMNAIVDLYNNGQQYILATVLNGTVTINFDSDLFGNTWII